MKRILGLMVALLALTAGLSGQTVRTYGALEVPQTWTAPQKFTGGLNGNYCTVTVDSLPSTPGLNNICVVVDSLDGCGVGGGGERIVCQWNGSSWVAISGSGSNFDPASPGEIGGTDPDEGIFTKGKFKSTPHADITAYGAVADNATDIGPALTDAGNAACPANGGTGVIYFPGTGNGFYLANGTTWYSGITCAGTTSLQLKVDGTLRTGNTFVLPDKAVWICGGGFAPEGFSASGPNCRLTAPGVYGTMGTSVTGGGSQTFTPTFTGGSIANMVVGGAISIGGDVACNITSISRTSAPERNVTATVSTPCRIPPGVSMTIAGVTDSSFNGSFIVLQADYPAGTLTWTQSGSAVSSSGGTVTGFDDDRFETCRITAVSGGNVTCPVAHSHPSTDVWGMVAMTIPNNTFKTKTLKGLAITSSYGAGIFLPQSTGILLDGVGVQARAYPTSVALECASCGAMHITHSSLMNNAPPNGQCTTNCGQQSYPYGMRVTSLIGSPDPAGWITVDGYTYIGGGVKVDVNGLSGSLNKMGNIRLRDTIVTQPVWAALVIDPRTGPSDNFHLVLENVAYNDNFKGYSPYAVVYTDRELKGNGSVSFDPVTSTELASVLVNKYYNGAVTVTGVDYHQGTPGLPLYLGRAGVLNDGITLKAEIDGSGANMSPALVPRVSANVTVDPASWTCSSNCTGASITTGVRSPRGSDTAGEIISGGGSSARVTVLSYNTATVAGDWVIHGAWVQAGTGQVKSASSLGDRIVFSLHSFGASDKFNYTTSTSGDAFNAYHISGWANDWWRPVVNAHKITEGTATAHNIEMYLYGGGGAGLGNRFWMPFFIYIPYSAKPAAWTDTEWDTEIARWRQQLMHGAVPPNMPAGVLAIDPELKLNWGSDVNMYRGAADQLKTDDDFAARNLSAVNTVDAPSLKQAGLPISTGANVAWRCDEGSGTTCVDGANNLANAPNSATVTSGTWSGATSPFANSVVFNGSTTRLDSATQTGTSFARTDKFSVSLAYYPGSVAGAYAVMGNLDTTSNNIGWEIGTSGTNVEVVLINNEGAGNRIYVRTTTNTLTAAAWHQIGFTYDGSGTAAGVTVYIDGVARAKTVVADALSSDIVNSKVVRIGQRHSGSRQVPNTTQIANVHIWPRVVATGEMSLLNSAPLRTPIPEYTFNKNRLSGYPGFDASGNLPLLGYLQFPTSASVGTPIAGFVHLAGRASASGVVRLCEVTSSGSEVCFGRDAVNTVRNQSGATINKGSVVCADGSNGTTPTVVLADADGACAHPYGFAASNILNNTYGTVWRMGTFTGVSTVGFAQGALLYLSNTAGAVTDTAPANKIPVATVILANANGVVDVLPLAGHAITAHELESGTSGSSSRPFQFPASWNSTVPSSTYLNTYMVPVYSTTALSIDIPASCTGSVFYARQAATAEETFDLKHTPCTTMTGGSCTAWGSTSTICTATIGAGAVTAAFSGSGASGITSGGRLEWVGGGDFSLSGIAITAKGSQTGGE